jgi:UDP-N-acetylglucosamine 2-epimerase (non-hydrolysing)
VDDPGGLENIVRTLREVSRSLPIIFPVHPRTRQRLSNLAPSDDGFGVHCLDPLGYLDFLALQQHATVVITDSGGVQEETTFLQVPCLTLRANTERPITVTCGTNKLIGQDMAKLQNEVERISTAGKVSGQVPPLWDGKTGERIAETILSQLIP